MTQPQTSSTSGASRAKKRAKKTPAKPAGAAPVSRRTRKKERTRQRIYECAMDLFTERGFDNVTIEEICEAADIAKATYFLHFKTKASLIFESTARLTELLRDELATPSKSARKDLERVTHLMLERWGERREVMEAMTREVLASPISEIGERPENEEFIQLYVEIFRRGQKSGELRKDVLPELAALSFFATASSIAAVHAQKMPGADIGPFIDQFMNMVFDGLVNPATRKKKAGR